MANALRRHFFRGLDRAFVKPALSPRVPATVKRRWMDTLSAVNLSPRDVEREPVDMDGVPAQRVTVGNPGDQVILYLHGGGYLFGSPRTHASITGALAREAGATVYVPEYRLAPEHCCPAAVTDAARAYRWLLDQGVAPQAIVIAGDSAGGGLTLATALALRDAGTPLPAGLLTISPWVDLTGSGDSVAEVGNADPMLSVPGLYRSARLYLGNRDARDPLASPLYGDLSGLPPLMIQVGEIEILRSDAERLAAAAREAGVAVEFKQFDGLWHVFHLHAGMLPQADAALAELAAFARECWS